MTTPHLAVLPQPSTPPSNVIPMPLRQPPAVLGLDDHIAMFEMIVAAINLVADEMRSGNAPITAVLEVAGHAALLGAAIDVAMSSPEVLVGGTIGDLHHLARCFEAHMRPVALSLAVATYRACRDAGHPAADDLDRAVDAICFSIVTLPPPDISFVSQEA